MASPPVIEDPAHASRRAKIRIGVAVTLLVTAVGILAVLNQHKTATGPGPITAPPPAQESISSQESEKPAEAETPQIAGMASPPPPVSPEPLAEPTQAPPPPPVAGVLPASPTVKTAPAASLPAEKPAASLASTKSAPTQPAPKPAQEPATPKPAAVTAMPEPIKAAAPKEYVVQLGVFSDMENAKQLQAKLAEHGIPSHTETRVQVGPFKTRAEADLAREKLKALGISAVIAPR